MTIYECKVTKQKTQIYFVVAETKEQAEKYLERLRGTTPEQQIAIETTEIDIIERKL